MMKRRFYTSGAAGSQTVYVGGDPFFQKSCGLSTLHRHLPNGPAGPEKKQSCTVAILAQGTSWADAIPQAISDQTHCGLSTLHRHLPNGGLGTLHRHLPMVPDPLCPWITPG